MKRSRKRVLCLALLILSGLTFAAAAKLRGSNTTETDTLSDAKRSAYVRRSLLSPKLVWHLNALGDRLERPGRERLRVTGTLSWTEDSQTEEVTALFEFPERLRLTTQRGNQTHIFTFDGEQVRSDMETVPRDLIETLIYGSAEHFFTTQMQGRATRFLGSRFRDDDGSIPVYTGAYYDIYKVAEEEQVRLYYFNSDTLLLERVTYELNRNSATVKVEERLGGWTKEQGQQVARRIERLENGESIFVLTIRAASLSQRAADGIFAN